MALSISMTIVACLPIGLGGDCRHTLDQETPERAQLSSRVQVALQLRQAAQVMERTQQTAQEGLGDPLRFRQEYQHRYYAAPGRPHGEPSATPKRTQEQQGQQQQYQYEGTRGPHGDQEPSPSPAGEENQYQYRYEGTLDTMVTHRLHPTGSLGQQRRSPRMQPVQRRRRPRDLRKSISTPTRGHPALIQKRRLPRKEIWGRQAVRSRADSLTLVTESTISPNVTDGPSITGEGAVLIGV